MRGFEAGLFRLHGRVSLKEMSVAVWQVVFTIVQRRALERLPAGYAQQLAAIAPLGASSSAELQTWGETDGNRIDVWTESGKPVRMSARVDVRRLDARFGALLLQFVKTANAVLVRGDGVVVEPRAGDFGAALRSSDAWRYAADPAAFIASHIAPDDDDS
jgi:hypothetical protein